MEYKGTSDFGGSYKLSESVINHILSRDVNGCDSISNYEILALIHFSQICNVRGEIEEYKVTELSNIIGCSRRACYNILNNLADKGFIEQSASNWCGYRKIIVLDNDFSDSDYNTVRYLNTNHSYFNHYHPDFMEFKRLSLYAKKTLLIILLKYQHKFGYRVEINTLKTYLGVSNTSKVMAYINELRGMFDERVFEIHENKKERIKNHNLMIHSKLPCFVPQSSISERQDCYIKYHLDTLFRMNGVSFNLSASKLPEQNMRLKCLQQLYSTYIYYNSKGVAATTIEDIILNHVLSFGAYNEFALYNINKALAPLIKNIS